MTFEELCTTYRLRRKTDVDGTVIAFGKFGHIYEYGGGDFGVVVMCKTARAFAFSLRRLLAAGCTVRQRGENEGCASFSPENSRAVIQAIREAKITRIPRRTAEQIANLKASGSRFQFGVTGEPKQRLV